MELFKKLFILTILFFGGSCYAFADHPEAHLGIYGIQHQPNLAGYKQYVGQTVKYLPANQGEGNYEDEKAFLNKGGVFNKEYIIAKVSGNDKRMTFLLQEKDGKDKVKMVVNNQYEYYSYENYTYCITDTYTIPLLLVDKFNEGKAEYKGKVYPEQPNGPVQMEVVDLVLQETILDITQSHKAYPKVSLLLKDKESGKTYYADPEADFSAIGKVFSNAKYKCKYYVIGIDMKQGDSYPYKYEKYYTVKNSIDGSTKDVPVSTASSSAFSGDDDGNFMATLTKVEKPSNSAVRYGNTTTVTEQNITKFSYVDNFIDILIFANKTQFNFILKNVSDNTIKVVWNEAVFVDIDGSTSKIMHSGIKYSQREGDQPASTIIKGAKLEDIAAPTDRVYFSDVLSEWISKSLYENADVRKEGQTIKLMLPIQVKDVVNEYIFEFEIKFVYEHPEYLAS